MTNTPDTCPNAPDGKHRYFIYRVVTEYEPVLQEQAMAGPLEYAYDYEKVDYALSGCNCGKAIKRKIEVGGDI